MQLLLLWFKNAEHFLTLKDECNVNYNGNRRGDSSQIFESIVPRNAIFSAPFGKGSLRCHCRTIEAELETPRRIEQSMLPTRENKSDFERTEALNNVKGPSAQARQAGSKWREKQKYQMFISELQGVKKSSAPLLFRAVLF
jgi:hypothetical protein